MSPRQLLRAAEIRAPEQPRTLGNRTDRQVRQYPDAAGSAPGDSTLNEFSDVLTSRLRLNAGSTDWRLGPSPGQGGGTAAARVLERLEGDRDGVNLRFVTSAPFYPQTLRLSVNGLLQAFAADGTADFTLGESQGTGTGYDTVYLAWAPLTQDQLLADYQPAATDAA